MTGSITQEDHWQGLSEKVVAARPYVRGWLYCVAFLVFAMVLVGGATRLTDSGLSITEWKPIHGAIPPLSVEAWQEEFEKYKQIPEYEQVNKGMSLDEFKTIFWWEWGHRQLGRFIGLAFFVPMMIFWLSGRLSRPIKPRVLILFVLGGLQGAIGWWMVASGLSERVDVSQYRLAVHLTLACVIFVALLWVARGYRSVDEVPECVSADRHLWPFAIVLGLLLVQIFFGALVAGTHAGKTYNTWPLMDGSFIPDLIYDSVPAWLSAFEDLMTIQFNHRMMAYILLAVGLLAALRLMRDGFGASMRAMVIAFKAGLVVQVILGILTLLFVVPLGLALAHQAGAIFLLAVATFLVRDLKDN
ncbi:MAG: COX15/CtaA family protein [Cohaesibacter sp.]|jgi:cytochrome c oxidase assembly protein subunit 15|nr:COX15/CtaA family protein [Cohaesibacter sp.]